VLEVISELSTSSSSLDWFVFRLFPSYLMGVFSVVVVVVLVVGIGFVLVMSLPSTTYQKKKNFSSFPSKKLTPSFGICS